MEISVVLISYNDERHLLRCLPTLTFSDDVIVVDVGSSDGSKAIAKSFGARVLEHEKVDFAEKAHSFAASFARFDWILFADPDMEFPSWVGERLPPMIERYADENLGMVLLPMLTCTENTILWHGRKGGVRGRKAVIHRNRAELPGLLHHRGFEPKEDFITLGLVSPNREGIRHYSVGGNKGLMAKTKRYLPFEAESRYAVGQRFSWNALFRELYQKTAEDLIKKVYCDRIALRMMMFQFINVTQGYLALRRLERKISSENNMSLDKK